MLIFLYCFLFTASWTSAFSVGSFSLPFIFAGLYNFSLIFRSDLQLKRNLFKILLLPFSLVLIYIFSTSIFNYHEKTFNYTLAYTIFPFFYCYFPSLIKRNFPERKKLLNVFFYGCFFVAIFSILEFLIRYYFGFDISSLIPHGKDNFAFTTTDKGHVLFRSRAFSTEPMITGIFLSTSLHYFLLKLTNYFESRRNLLDKKIKIKIIIIWIFLLAIISTGSATSVFISLFGILLILIRNIYLMIKSFLLGGTGITHLISNAILIICLAPVLIIYFNYDPMKTSINMVLDKFLLDSNYNSVIARTSIFQDYYGIFLNDPFGLSGAVGKYSKDGSAINWFLTLLGDLGFMGTVIFLCPLVLFSFKGIKSSSRNSINAYEKFSLILIPITGLMFHGTFYASPIWPLIILIPYL